MNKKIAIIAILVCLVFNSFLFAQGENLTLKIAVMGPGDELYFWWGHIALVIEDANIGQNFFYDYGLFSFKQDNFFYNFAMGRLWYGYGVSLADRNLVVYKYTNRDITYYTLDLPAQTRFKIMTLVNKDVTSENPFYEYHHFDDNCSTRIRDIIDVATEGQFSEPYKNTKSRFTLRDQVRRHTWFAPVENWLLSFWMGQGIDTDITVWEDMFLPSEVGLRIDEFYYTDIYGERRKLVSHIDKVNVAENRPEVLDVPKNQWLPNLLFSLALSSVFGFFFYLQSKKKRIGYILAGCGISICGLFFGFAALILYFMSLFTNHSYTFNNANMIFCTPLLLVTFPVGIFYAFTKNAQKRVKYDMLIRIIWLLTTIGIIVSMLIKILPWFWQKNLPDQLLLLPLALTFALQPIGLKDVLKKYGR